MHVSGMGGRADVARTVPGRPHLEEFGERGDLARRRDAADVPQVAADVIDQLFLDERHAVPQ